MEAFTQGKAKDSREGSPAGPINGYALQRFAARATVDEPGVVGHLDTPTLREGRERHSTCESENRKPTPREWRQGDCDSRHSAAIRGRYLLQLA